ncbi:MAG: neprosin family prolyl endopeptidase [Sulfurovum sp.]|nr:neprosin family prolyl endopeptidase [Sulfurovum sp.]
MRGVNEGAADRERIEVGVIKSQHNDFSVLFLFYDTQDNQWGFYSGTGSNNGFTLVDPSPIKIGEELPDYSVIGSHQAEILVAVYREQTQGHWWVWIHDRWIGFYNTNLWHENGLKHEAYQIDFGGEVMTMGTDMGSGKLPDEDYGYAAYQRNIRYVNKDTGDFTKVESAMERTRYPECYDVTFTNSTSSTWGSYIYFGGSAEDPRCETYPY